MAGLHVENQLAEILAELEAGQLADAPPHLLEISAEIDTLSKTLRSQSPEVPFADEEQLSAILDHATRLTESLSLEQTIVEPARRADQPGVQARLLGQYELMQELGAGGMGTIYRARHQKLNRTVALKVLPRDRFQSTEMVDRFEREMRAVGMLHHPNIVAAHDAGEVDGCHYLAMELVDGEDLSKLMMRVGRVDIADACEIIRQAALGLQHIADHGLVHRDIKPSNIMLARPYHGSDSVTVKILDLGLALLDPSQSGTSREITATGQVMGTIDYMAPEQAFDTHSIDIRADLYGLGATLYKLLAGRAPLQEPRHATTIQRIRALELETPPSVITLRPDCPLELSNLVDRLLAKQPEDRPTRPDAIVTTLAKFAAGANLAELLVSGVQTDAEPMLQRQDTTVARGNTALSLPASGAPALPPGDVTTTPEESGRMQRHWRWFVASAIAGVLLLLGAVVLFVDTPHGVVRIEANDPAVKVAFENDELRVVGAEPEAMVLKAGPHGLRVRKGEFEFVTKDLQINKGDQITLRIEILPGKIEVVNVGKGVLDSRELPATRSNPVASTPAKVVSPDISKPFTLIRHETPMRNFATVAGAVAEARAGDVIQVQGDKAYLMNLESQINKPLIFRAATGTRPRLIFHSLQEFQGSVSFQGFDLDSRKTRVDVAGERLEFVNCRILADGIRFGGKTFEARDSLFLLNRSITRYLQPNQEFRMENCLYLGQMGVFALHDAETAVFHLIQNTFYQEVFNAEGLIAATDKPQIHIHAEGNIFHHHSQRGFFDIPEWPKQFGKTLHWSGKNNLYSNLWTLNEEGQWHPANMEDWNKLVGYDEPGSQMVPQVVLQFVRLMEASIDELRPELTRLLDQARLRNDLPDLGPNLALVGPGDGYLKWLEHEQRTPAELRPEIEAGGPFVLLSAGKAPVGYRSLQEAEQQAVDGDTIELRQDGACGLLELKHEMGRHLILRGAAGYNPFVQLLRNSGNDRLSLENLSFEANVEGASWDAEKKEFRGRGGIHRISNCQFAANTGWLLSPFLPLGDDMPTIHHSRLTLLNYGVAANVRLQLRETVLAGLQSGREEGRGGAVELDHCLFWNPEPRFAFRPISFGVAAVLTNQEDYTVKNTYLSGAGALFHASPKLNLQPINNWHGEKNLHAAPNYLWGSSLFLDLADWQAGVKDEVDSREDFPPLANPHLWSLVSPQVPGAGLPAETTVGADPRRIATTRVP